MVESVVDLNLDRIKGIGPKTKEKLIDNGITSVLDLAVTLPKELEEILGGKEENVNAFIISARRLLEESGLLEREFITASELMEKRKAMGRITTSSMNLDELLGGGVETQAITEFYGDFGSGKTQICHTLCVNCQLPPEEKGLSGGTIYIDTEGTFRPERIYQIAETKGLDAEAILKKIILCKIYNSNHLEVVIRTLGKYIEKFKAKLIVVDSVISLHRAEFIGRGTLAERQQRLNVLIHRLLRQADMYNVAVVVTNQVQTKPDTFFGDPTRPAGGNVIAHACTYRVYLRKSGQNRTATMVDSPCHPYSDVKFRITEKGIEDLATHRSV
jgi:DNA repair protein RadA